MAVNILQDPNDPENKNGNNPALGGVPEAPVDPGAGQAGQAPVAPTAQPVAQNVVQPARARTGSGFQNLQTVLAANRQNRLGQTVGSGVSNVAGQARQGTQQGLQQFQQESDKGRIGGSEDFAKRQSVINRITGYQAPQSLVEQNKVTSGMGFNERDPNQAPVPFGQESAVTAPTAQPVEQPLVSDEEAKEFARLRAGQYTGPQGIKDYDKLSDQASRAEGLGQLTRSMGGQQELLREFVGNRPDYSRGKRAMDALILGQTGAKDLQQARSTSRGLMSDIKQAQDTAGQVAGMNKALSSKFGQDLTSELGSAGTDAAGGSGLVGGISQDLYKKLGTQEASAAQEFQGFQTRLANKQLLASDVQKYIQPLIDEGGLDSDTSTFGLTPDDFKKAYEQGKYSLESVADKTQAAKLAALQKLSGKEDIKLDQSKIGQLDQAIKLGAGAGQFKDYAAQQKQLEEDTKSFDELLAQTKLRDRQQKELLPSIEKDIRLALDPIRSKPLTEYGQPGEISTEAQRRELQYSKLMELSKDAKYSPEMQAKIRDLAKAQSTGTDDLGQAIFTDRQDEGWSYDNKLDNIQKALGFNSQYESDINTLPGITAAMRKEKGQGSISDLMAEAERSKLGPTRAQSLEQQPMYDQSKYDELRQRLLGRGLESEVAPGKQLVDYLGGRAGINRIIAATAGMGPIGQAASFFSTPVGSEISNFLGETGKRWFSDKKLKKNIKPADKKIQKFLDNLKPYSYDYKNEDHGKGKQLGIMAQDLEKSDLGKVAVEELPEGKAVNYGKLAGTLIASNAQLNERIKKLEKGRKK